jgi:hypothetical protein
MLMAEPYMAEAMQFKVLMMVFHRVLHRLIVGLDVRVRHFV